MSTDSISTYAITTRDGRSGWIEVLDGRIESGFFVFPGNDPVPMESLESERTFDPARDDTNILTHHLVRHRIQ